jgi:hypothetical protein
MPSDVKPRKRMVVEEVGETSESQIKTELEDATTADSKPVEEKSELRDVVKEKVEELQTLTEHIGDDVEKSADVQEEIALAAEKVEAQAEKPRTEFIPVRPPSGPSPLLILIPGVLLLGALLGGVYFYQKGVNQENKSTPTPESTSLPLESTAPSASPAAKLDLTKYSINVQNGSGIPGTAGAAKDILTKAGFKVGATGNADNYDYTDTIIKVKSDVPADFVTKLATTLSETYKVAKSQTLSDTSTDSVVVIIGSSKAE